MNKIAYLHGYLSKSASLEKEAGPMAVLGPMMLASGLYGTAKSGRKAYESYKAGDKKQALKDLAWTGLDLAGTAVGAGGTLNSVGRASKLARIAAQTGKTPAQIMQRAGKLRSGSLAYQRLGEQVAAKKMLSGATKPLAKYRALVNYAQTLDPVNRAKYIGQAEKILGQMQSAARKPISFGDRMDLSTLKLGTGIRNVTDKVTGAVGRAIPASAKKMWRKGMGTMYNVTEAPFIAASKMGEGAGTFGRGAVPKRSLLRNPMGVPFERRMISSTGTPHGMVGNVLSAAQRADLPLWMMGAMAPSVIGPAPAERQFQQHVQTASELTPEQIQKYREQYERM